MQGEGTLQGSHAKKAPNKRFKVITGAAFAVAAVVFAKAAKHGAS